MQELPKLDCGKISDDVNASKTEIVWYCKSCCRAKNKEKDTRQVKMVLSYVDDIVGKVRGEPSCLLDTANFSPSKSAVHSRGN